MISAFLTQQRKQMTLLLFSMTIFCFCLSAIRVIFSERLMFIFLNWNLFLAFIPWFISSILINKKQLATINVFFLIAIWLLFFPNSPYILTDLFHLRNRGDVPIWYDLILILSFAWTGLTYGFVSLLDIEKIFLQRISRRFTNIIIVVMLFVVSFGVYIGRFLRWNSWDIISNPSNLLYDIGIRISDPLAHPRTWGMTLLMGILLNMMYGSLKLLQKSKW
jgi:uncharacterized membrane protein